MRRTSTRQRAAYLGSCTNQIGLNMSGAPPTVGRKGSLGRYIGSRVQSNQKYCGPVMYQGQIWKTNDEPCVKKVPRGESFNSGVGHIGAPRFLCNKNCKTDTQQTKDHAPIDNGDKVHPDGLWDGSNVEEDVLPEEDAPIPPKNSLWIGKPGSYFRSTITKDVVPDSLFTKKDLINVPKMTAWIAGLDTFIKAQGIEKIVMQLPSFSSDAPYPDQYLWDPASFWYLMSGIDTSGTTKTFTKWPSSGDLQPLAEWQSIIFSFEKVYDPTTKTMNFQPYTLAHLIGKNPKLKWLWLTSNSSAPFMGRNVVLSKTPALLQFKSIQKTAVAPPAGTVAKPKIGDYMWNDYYNAATNGWTSGDREFDFLWDMVGRIQVVNFFANQVAPDSSVVSTTGIGDLGTGTGGSTLKTGIVWEVDKLSYQWTTEMLFKDAPQSYSMDWLIHICHKISLNGSFTKFTGALDDSWTWGLTSKAQLGGLSGINNVGTIWTAWNSIKVAEAAAEATKIYNVEMFVEWYGYKTSGTYPGTHAQNNRYADLNLLQGLPNADAGGILMKGGLTTTLNAPPRKVTGFLDDALIPFVSTRVYELGDVKEIIENGLVIKLPPPAIPPILNPMEYRLFKATLKTQNIPSVLPSSGRASLEKMWATNLRLTTGQPQVPLTKGTFTGLAAMVEHDFSTYPDGTELLYLITDGVAAPPVALTGNFTQHGPNNYSGASWFVTFMSALPAGSFGTKNGKTLHLQFAQVGGIINITSYTEGSESSVSIDLSMSGPNAKALFGPGTGAIGTAVQGAGGNVGGGIIINAGTTLSPARELFYTKGGDPPVVVGSHIGPSGNVFVPGSITGTSFTGSDFSGTKAAWLNLKVDGATNDLGIYLTADCSTIELAMAHIIEKLQGQLGITVDIVGSTLEEYLNANTLWNQNMVPFALPPINSSGGPFYTAMVSLAPDQFGGAPTSVDIEDGSKKSNSGTLVPVTPSWYSAPTSGLPSCNAFFPDEWVLGKEVGGSLNSWCKYIFDTFVSKNAIQQMYFSYTYAMPAFTTSNIAYRKDIVSGAGPTNPVFKSIYDYPTAGNAKHEECVKPA